MVCSAVKRLRAGSGAAVAVRLWTVRVPGSSSIVPISVPNGLRQAVQPISCSHPDKRARVSAESAAIENSTPWRSRRSAASNRRAPNRMNSIPSRMTRAKTRGAAIAVPKVRAAYTVCAIAGAADSCLSRRCIGDLGTDGEKVTQHTAHLVETTLGQRHLRGRIFQGPRRPPRRAPRGPLARRTGSPDGSGHHLRQR